MEKSREKKERIGVQRSLQEATPSAKIQTFKIKVNPENPNEFIASTLDRSIFS